MDSFEVTIIGAGVVGLAIAREMSKAGYSTLVIEKENKSGEEITSRNSGVIHAGMYYPSNFLKAKLCTQGNKLMYEYLSSKKIPHKKTGKLILATSKKDIIKLNKIYSQGLKNGVTLNLLNSEEVREIEPQLSSEGAIYSPNTGILDVPELITALEGDIQHYGGLVIHNTKFMESKQSIKGFNISCQSSEKFQFDTKILINSSGLSSDKNLKRMSFFKDKFIDKINYAKGHYFKYSGKNPFKKLVYPVNNQSSLGIHVSFDLSGQLKFGPDLKWVDKIDYSVDEDLKEIFVKDIQAYWKNLDPQKLHPDYAGIRPKIQNKGESMKDFSISGEKNHGIKGFINLQGIESPGVTSSLSIAKYVRSLLAI